MVHTESLTPDNFAVHTVWDFERRPLGLKKTVTASNPGQIYTVLKSGHNPNRLQYFFQVSLEETIVQVFYVIGATNFKVNERKRHLKSVLRGKPSAPFTTYAYNRDSKVRKAVVEKAFCNSNI